MHLPEAFCFSHEDTKVPVRRGSSVERRSSKLKYEQKNTERKNISLYALVCVANLSVFDLWGNIRLSSELCCDICVNVLCESKVAEFEFEVVANQNVF